MCKIKAFFFSKVLSTCWDKHFGRIKEKRIEKLRECKCIAHECHHQQQRCHKLLVLGPIMEWYQERKFSNHFIELFIQEIPFGPNHTFVKHKPSTMAG